jgi:antirestriction protein ArdC
MIAPCRVRLGGIGVPQPAAPALRRRPEMASNQRKPLTDEERTARRERERALAKEAVAQLRSSTGWRRWIAVRARTALRRYSVRNQLLIALQDPSATRVAGFRAWIALGYCVRRGEHSRISVWARCEPSKKRLQHWRENGADPETRPKPFYKLEPVFDRAQVEPLPPPADPAPLDPPIAPIEGETLHWALPLLEQQASALQITVRYVDLPAGHDGSYRRDRKSITVSSAVSINQQVAAFCHELAHALVDLDRRPDDPSLSYAIEELVAESVALTVCGFLGLDTTGNSIPYMAVWSEGLPDDAFEQIAGLVDRLARRLEDALGPAQNECMGEGRSADAA